MADFEWWSKLTLGMVMDKCAGANAACRSSWAWTLAPECGPWVEPGPGGDGAAQCAAFGAANVHSAHDGCGLPGQHVWGGVTRGRTV